MKQLYQILRTLRQTHGGYKVTGVVLDYVDADTVEDARALADLMWNAKRDGPLGTQVVPIGVVTTEGDI